MGWKITEVSKNPAAIADGEGSEGSLSCSEHLKHALLEALAPLPPPTLSFINFASFICTLIKQTIFYPVQGLSLIHI